MTKEKLNRIVIGVIVLGFMVIPVYLCYSCNLLNHSKKLGVANVIDIYPYHNGGYTIVYEYIIQKYKYPDRTVRKNHKVKKGKYYMIYNPSYPNNSSIILFDFPLNEKLNKPSIKKISVDCFCNVSHLK